MTKARMVVPNQTGASSAPDGTVKEAGSPGDAREWVWLARLRRPQGRKGELYAEILTDFPDKFAERKQLWLLAEPAFSRPAGSPSTPPRQVALINHWLHKGGVVMHFEGVNTISDAEQIAGLIVALPIEDRAPLAQDEAYIADLIGCTLIDIARGNPVAVGQIEDVDLTAGPVPLLIARSAIHDEILIPFAKDYLRNIDIAGKRIEMALPVGLVDLNETEKA